MQVLTYVFFDGRTEEAINFYRDAIGATDVEIMRYKDSPEPAQPGMVPPGSENKVMHSRFRVGDTLIMASDGHCGGKPSFQGFSLTIGTQTEGEARKLFDALASGGQVNMPLTKTFFSPAFGMLVDRFGVSWMILVESERTK